ncbi:putative 12-oxophytodienoate reductase 4 [Glarea lozoyensis 74030]|uniref:Putative 12-oxophytodienoate reductase 4 n=1 Tax=Glarea lozoyensis (strain ATCC 74030 / MF5533) TaxID=1104152 RepID=H0ECP5_GLAL7|nr:putative 12-oxophytodienoate reductase 4 [Glarea lozoyensis 74030]
MGSIATTSEEKLPGNGKFSSSDAPRGSSSKIFTPLTIGNGTLQLYHRIILAPLTRNRGSPLNPNSTPSDPNRIWIPNALIKEYYLQRTTPGGLLISEGIPPNLEGNGMPGVPGLFHPAQIAGWKDVVEAVHEKGGYMRQIADYVRAAKAAVEECGFDGVEVHGGNGYLPEQFLSSNINVRTDAYGGSPEKRSTIGQEKLAIRLTPFGMFNQARGTQRLETWGYLCKELKRRYALSYVHFVEPRYEQVFSLEEKNKYLESWGFPDIDLKLFRDIFGSTPFVSAGGWNDKNCWGVLEEDTYDAFAIGRLFLSTPDMIERLKNGLPLNEYNRPRFYGPFPDPEVGYTDYPTWEEKQKKAKQIKV